MIKQHYDDGKKHIHVLSYGGGTQSTALLLMALKGEINGVIPDYIIFSDTGWEPQHVYNWVNEKKKEARPVFSETAKNKILGDVFQNPELLEGAE
ncbi:phosphoadenosine phosphosulfate reductase family protein [Bacillus sp. FSL M8-0256]|uniref:phosphoadenosine phosphosulfate reductase domain-containing protein n=1 Tax=Bacillus sp. FSL M8-0256 TaxID=2954578 RepID=UPI0030FB2DDC